VRIPFLGMPNVIAEREVAPEFLQGRATPRRLARAMEKLLENPQERVNQQAAFTEVIAKLGQPGAGMRAALAVARLLRS